MAPKAVLLDLGNVVIGVDFRRVFNAWAAAAGTAPDRFHSRWRMDDAYRGHERGELSFAEYTAHLSQVFQVELSAEQWQDGWNDIWTQPFHDVIELLPQVAARYPLYCFTNTNDTHAVYWRRHFADALGHFERIFVSSEMGERKPDPAAFTRVCEHIGTHPEQVLFLDDTGENVNGAGRAGLQARQVDNEAAVVRQLTALLQ